MGKRKKDKTLHICKICKQELTASGMPSHLFHKHYKLSSQEYVEKYGEFRKKYLEKEFKLKAAGEKFKCKECQFIASSHKQLIQHINKSHKGWEDYFVKHFFEGKWPQCKCGCGGKVKLIKSGKDDRGNLTYRRSYIQGHDTKTRQPGYRVNSYEQRMRMRKSAIDRLKRGESTFHQSGPSKGEQEVVDFLKSLKLNIIQGDKKILSGQEIDIIIPDLKIAIEYNGGYFHSDSFKDKKYHLRKTEELSKQGYRLIHIWETDWFKKRPIIESMLTQICRKTQRTIYARKTEVKQIDREQAKSFITDNHLQGFTVGKVYLGLFHTDELVSVMSFSKLRRATGLTHKEGDYELLRFCSKLNTNVIGAASKMFSYFTKKYKPVNIISYANRDWSVGNLYTVLGMKFKGYTPPGYFYVKSRIRYSRFKFQKHKLVEQGADPNMTEYEIMLDRGYYRIWDCGNYRYHWSRKELS